MERRYDAVIVGAGPNGLAAAITLARAQLQVLVLEANETIGGGCRTQDLTLPGFRHDVCAAIHPMGVASPFFKDLPLQSYGLEWCEPPIQVAHPLPDGSVALLHKSMEQTSSELGRDGHKWRDLLEPLVVNRDKLLPEILRPLRIPAHPFLMARFGMTALRSCRALVTSRFAQAQARALFAGCAAHSFLPLEAATSASFGLVLALTAHGVGWPCARGGSEQIVRAMASYLRDLGGDIATGVRVTTLQQLPESKAVLFDITPRQILAVAGEALPAGYKRGLRRFQYGPGVFKMDWALSGPIPWRNPECARAGTVHVGGPFEDIADSERANWASPSRPATKPFVLVAQQTAVDPTRAPAGKHTGWAYCHVPHGSTEDMTGRIEDQIERFAPGFRDTILARHSINPSEYEIHNANFIGGDIGGGANTFRQFLCRPVFRWDPYSTPNPKLFICSSSTPPGGGVHGMCGYLAAQSVLRRVFNRSL